MPKLTKTQQKLIDAAKARGGRHSIESCGGKGPEGGRVSFGARDRDALFKLVEMKLVEITHRSSSTDCNRGYSTYSTVFAFRLIDQPSTGA